MCITLKTERTNVNCDLLVKEENQEGKEKRGEEKEKRKNPN